MSGVFYQVLYDIEVMWRKTIKHAFSMFYTLTKHGSFILFFIKLWPKITYKEKEKEK